MEETYFTKAIVLNRTPWREDGARVIVYTEERGKLDLVARGARKANSKLAAHLEPITFSNLMVARGRQYDYAAAAASEDCYFNIKSDLEKLAAAGQIINIFNKLVKENEKDEKLFFLLSEALEILNNRQLPARNASPIEAGGSMVNNRMLFSFFTLKLLTFLGHRPELYNCVVCGKKILPGGNKFDLAKGGVVCKICSHKGPAPHLVSSQKKASQTPCSQNAGLTISDDCVKVLRIIAENDLINSIKIKINNELRKEARETISSFLKFHHHF